MTDIEIAQKAKYEPIENIAKKLNIPDEYLYFYGKNKAKIDLNIINKFKR